MYHWTFVAPGSKLNLEADSTGGWRAYGESLQTCYAPGEDRLTEKLQEVRNGFVTIMPRGVQLAAYDPVGRGFDPIVQSNTDTKSAMVSYYDRDSEMFALTVVLCDPAIPVWLDMLKFVRANSLRFTVDIGFVGFPPFTSHHEAVSYDEFIAADFLYRRAIFSAEATLRVLPIEKA
jgi:hypothetical protein